MKQVSSVRPNPVGLLIVKSNDGTTLANPIDTVLTALGVTFVAAALYGIVLAGVSDIYFAVLF